MTITSPIIVALDYPDAASAMAMAERLNPQEVRLKVGKELFTAAGPALVEALQNKGFELFLDLKFHDIPNTVAGALRSAARLGVWMANVHVSGGRRMLEAAAEAVQNSAHKPLLTGVTVLTSMGAEELHELGITKSPAEQVEHLARLAQECGLDGVVCSAQEAAQLHEACGKEFLLVTPGIRPAGSQQDDQTRIMTPPQAQAAGVDYMVIGRPITKAADPTAAVRSILESLR
ncbi:MAG TPA: orotidine-5'-phosphate decarboxylase [Alcanivoracaceae bacterium]|nr:orotidine-5'-phosphate decarboxylase [Alcanivoracaceae bacterium]